MPKRRDQSYGFTPAELRAIRAMKDPNGVQKFLNSLPYHLAPTCWSPRKVLRERTVLAGEILDVPRWLNSFDAFALPSLAEGMSNTLLEAMAVGIAPLASRVGGNPEVIEEGRSGLLFEAGDSEALAAHLKTLALDAKWRRQLGENARQRADAGFSLQRMLQNYERMYLGVLRRGGMVQPALAVPS